MKARPTQSRRGVKGEIPPCRVKGQRPLWGLGQRPNCSAGDQHLKRTQQRCRQRSVPASNFARPQTRPPAALFNVYAVSRRWRDRTAYLSDMAACFRKQGFRACGRESGSAGHRSRPRGRQGFRACGRESGALRSPPTPLRSAHPCGLTFIAAVVCASADAIMPCRNGFADV